MMLLQEAALGRSIDRKVRILLALRKKFLSGDLPALLVGQGENREMENIDKILGVAILSGAVASKGSEPRGNVDEDKGSVGKTPGRGWNFHENKGS